MLLNTLEARDNMRNDDSLWAYKWIVFIGLIVIFFFWTVIVTAQSGVEYYKVITNNNLFRPLGWKPPNLTPKFELIGTWIGTNKDIRVAYVRNIRTNQIYRLGIGDTINGVPINNIEQNEVQMKTGGNYESPTLQFLNFSTSRRSTKRSSTGSSRSKTNTEKEKEKTTTSKTERRSGRTGGANWETQIKRFQNASAGERQQMIEQFRNMRRRRRNNE